MHVQYLCVGSGATEKYAALSGNSIQKSYRFTVTYQLAFAGWKHPQPPKRWPVKSFMPN